MTHPEPQTTLALKAIGGLLAVALALVVLASCAAGGQGGPTPTMSAPSHTPAGPTSPTPDPGMYGDQFAAEDGYIADGEGLSPFDVDFPAVGNLDRELLEAVQRASTDAARDGVPLLISSGWRSRRYQQALLDDAIVRYGSETEARKWVNTPERSTHVTGQAVDIGPTPAASWLSQHGSTYGLCQTYANEIWHYELATEPGGPCPRQISDASVGRYR